MLEGPRERFLRSHYNSFVRVLQLICTLNCRGVPDTYYLAPQVNKERGCVKLAYQYTNNKGTNYYLHEREVTLRGSGKKQRIFFFARDVRNGALEQVPDGYEVVENKRTGLPVLRRG